MKPLKAAAFAALLAPFVAVSPTQAQGVASVYAEQGKLIRAGEAVGTLGADLFGDKVNLYTGTVEFIQTDVSLPGNNALPVSVGRRLATGAESLTGRTDAAFGDWELEIPHLHGVYSTYGWLAQYDNGLRCSHFSVPPLVGGNSGPSTWLGQEYWHGHFMYVPGAGSQEILTRAPDNVNVPSDGSSWPLVTKNLWSLRCLNTMASGGGEGFIAISPDGTQYRFDWMVSRAYRSANKGTRDPVPFSTTGGTTAGARGAGQLPDLAVGNLLKGPNTPEMPNLVVGGLLKRLEVWIMPTVVTDRFGNTVTYTYNTAEPWKVQSIQSSDGRSLVIAYLAGTQRIQSVTDGTRTWVYSYRSTIAGAMLDLVTQSDGSFWQFNADKLNAGVALYLGSPSCDDDGGLDSTLETGTMKHPSGALGTFTIRATSHSKSFVERVCMNESIGEPRALYPRFFAHKSLTNKTLRRRAKIT